MIPFDRAIFGQVKREEVGDEGYSKHRGLFGEAVDVANAAARAL